ncbi:MAG: hypothetical protein AB1Z67_08115 [Candidatus Limnocylindrales bacterium]
MAILCRDIGLLFLQAPHTGSTSLGTLFREDFGGVKLLEDRVRDERGRIVLRQKHQSLPQLLEAGLITPQERQELLVVVGVRNPYDLVLTEYARNREAGTISASQRLLRRLRLSDDFSAPDFERFVVRRYAPNAFYRALGRVPMVPVDWTEGADHVIRFEAMQAGLDAALQKVGVAEPHPLPHRNPTRSRRDRDYRALYTPRARDIVSRVYARELRAHGYAFDADAGGEADGG